LRLAAARPAKLEEPMLNPVLFFDFDNTLTEGDILDQLLEQFSPNEAWRDWENAWAEGHLHARECLRLQVQNMCVSRERLLQYLSRVRIDPVFVDIVAWARARQAGVNIVSDSFRPLIEHILRCNGIDGVPVFANELHFAGNDRLVPSFPHYDAACARSANAKARHLAPYRERRIIFAGDGHTDLDAALVADVVFAKSTLAKELDARGIAFYPFDTLEPLLAYLETVAALVPMRAARA
jgi:2-hydroxy-3-keto-5-methylthiopentenyl-1-phosphate phosphatase